MNPVVFDFRTFYTISPPVVLPKNQIIR